MKSRLRIFAALAGFFEIGVLFAGTRAAVGAEEMRPNILWLIAEDMGPALGCYGQKEVETPNLDRLAREGTRYTRAYTTAPVCSPSRSAFMTGMFQTTIGAHNHRAHRDDGFQLPSGVRVLTGWFHDAGYFCANIVQLPPRGFLSRVALAVVTGADRAECEFRLADVAADLVCDGSPLVTVGAGAMTP